MQDTNDQPPAILITDATGNEQSLHRVGGVLEYNYTPCSQMSAIQAVAPFNGADTRQIIRQVEFYLSDQNLPTDKHLLGLMGGDGNGAVSLGEISSFKRMRNFKPRRVIEEVLRQSAVIDLVDNGKKVKRHFPLMLPILVAPEIDIEREHIERTLAENPHLTKNMLKPTGFEEFYTDPPISPQQHEQNQKLYDPDFSFATRIENAARHYRARRKMHTSTLQVFERWMLFGGISMNPLPPGGAEEEHEGLSKVEIAVMTETHCVDDSILDHEDEHYVDFELVALAFLSTEFPALWRNTPANVHNVCNVIVNFLNFLLHHDACPEYSKQIMSARRAVHEAEADLSKVPAADRSLQSTHGFNTACSVLHAEQYESSTGGSTWLTRHSHGLGVEDATAIFKTALVAFADEEQLAEIEARFAELDVIKERRAHLLAEYTAARADFRCDSPSDGSASSDGNGVSLFEYHRQRVEDSNDGNVHTSTDNEPESTPIPRSPFSVVLSETVGLEIIGLTPASDHASAVFDIVAGTIVPRMGRMHCRKWVAPFTAPQDLPSNLKQLPETLDFIVDEDVLEHCEIGMKLEATIRQLDIGVCWLDEIEQVHPRFYTTIPDFKAVKQRRREAEFLEDWLAAKAGDAGVAISESHDVPISVAVPTDGGLSAV